MEDVIPVCLRFSAVYSFSCEDCQVRYVGQNFLQLEMRIPKQLDISCKTNRPLNTPESSAIAIIRKR